MSPPIPDANAHVPDADRQDTDTPVGSLALSLQQAGEGAFDVLPGRVEFHNGLVVLNTPAGYDILPPPHAVSTDVARMCRHFLGIWGGPQSLDLFDALAVIAPYTPPSLNDIDTALRSLHHPETRPALMRQLAEALRQRVPNQTHEGGHRALYVDDNEVTALQLTLCLVPRLTAEGRPVPYRQVAADEPPAFWLQVHVSSPDNLPTADLRALQALCRPWQPILCPDTSAWLYGADSTFDTAATLDAHDGDDSDAGDPTDG
ncbi:hypothetical protein [Parahaliea mediterranea]|uniref:hypothetical protein n=1 Tax=Parahaliea mediterranea TaxID=651086 RepID=UPI000E2F98C6|nr:hypothetical protein [Parahaliea mediterranea]